MLVELRRARDLGLLDAIDALPREPFAGGAWRVVREGRDPTTGSPSKSRWCDGRFDILYTSLEQDGAIAEIEAFLSLQPVFPSKMRWTCFELTVRAERILKLADMEALEKLGVDAATYKDRGYGRTQEIADAAYFLGFDGLIAPSARWPCRNLMLFTEQFSPDAIEVTATALSPIDWMEWRRKRR
jgi:hypothetical protein